MNPRVVAGVLWHRIRDDYGGADRFAEYAGLLRAVRDAGYETMSVARFHERASFGEPVGRWVALRHDVDIRDVAGNEAFFAAEREVGATSTFYFRLSTAPPHRAFIARLLDAGFEVGYHFEEGATIAKRHRLDSREALLARRPEIQDLFRRNCAAFRRQWNRDLVSVASHGDWVNRRLGTTNNELISAELLAECGLRFEAYGADVLGRADVYVSDVASPPERWTGGYGLADALRDTRSPIYVLAHERRWHSARGAAARADADRLIDGLRYRLGRPDGAAPPGPAAHGE